MDKGGAELKRELAITLSDRADDTLLSPRGSDLGTLGGRISRLSDDRRTMPDMAVAAEPRTRRCLECGEELPLAAFGGPHGRPTLRCKPCHRRFKQRPEDAKAIDAAPDNEPAIRLRVALAQSRAAGMHFDATWDAALEVALCGLSPFSRDDWQIAFRSTKLYWREAYHRSPSSADMSLFLP